MAMSLIVRDQVVGTAGAVGKNGAAYTPSIDFGKTTGFVCARITSSAGSITVTQQCSTDGVTFYDPVDVDNNALGQVAAAMTVGTRYAMARPCPAKYARYKVVEGNVAATVVTMTLVWQAQTNS